MQTGEQKDASLHNRLARANHTTYITGGDTTSICTPPIFKMSNKTPVPPLYFLTLWLGPQINQCQTKTTLCVCVLGSLVRADGGEGGCTLPRRPGQDRSSHRNGNARQITWLWDKSRDFETNHVTLRQHGTFSQITWLSDKSRDFRTNHVTFRQITWLSDTSRDFQTNHVTFRQITWLSDKSRDFQTNHVTFRQTTWFSSSQSEMRRWRPS